MNNIKIVVIGGVASGASAAARARRLNENANITLVERGPDVSFANCGLPYFIGNEIKDRNVLAVQTPESLKGLLNIDILTRTEATNINRAHKTVSLKNLESGELSEIPYDKLILAPGASPLSPPIPGIESSRIYTLRNLQDMDRIKEAAKNTNKVSVVGGGFIGLEMAEQFRRMGKEVSLIELMDQVLPQMDKEMTRLIEDELKQQNISLILGDGIKGFEESKSGISCKLDSGQTVDTELVLLSIGVRPDTELARNAELELSTRGHIKVNEWQQTSDPDIYAAGDAVQTKDRVMDETTAVPLGGPANRQGRVIADHIFLGNKARAYPGSLGTAIVRVFEASAAMTGWSEKRLSQAGKPFRSVTVHDNHHAGYYPGAKPLALKILWDSENGRILGAQATGIAGVDKRIDVLATAILGKMTIDDLCHLELAYAPPFGSAKDLVNLAGFAACNIEDGLVEITRDLSEDSDMQIVDVRPEVLAKNYPLPGSVNIPLPALRSRSGELDKSRPVTTVCAVGKSSYFASRILQQEGFKVKSFSSGIRGNIDPRTPAKPPAPDS